MKKIIASSLSLLSAIVLLTACSNESITEMPETTNPVVGTVAEDEIPSEPKLRHADKAIGNLEDLGSLLGKNFVGVNGEILSIASADRVVNIHELDSAEDPEEYYALIYNFAYLTYVTPFYEIGSFDFRETSNTFYTCLDSYEKVEEFNKYLENKSEIYTVTIGDVLANGLICTDAETTYGCDSYGNVIFKTTEACFSGELTLTGTIQHIEYDPILGEGYLTFLVGADNGNVVNEYEANLIDKVKIGDTVGSYESFELGYISDLSEEYASLIGENQYINAQVTLKDIHIYEAQDGTIRSSSATLVDLNVI